MAVLAYQAFNQEFLLPFPTQFLVFHYPAENMTHTQVTLARINKYQVGIKQKEATSCSTLHFALSHFSVLAPGFCP